MPHPAAQTYASTCIPTPPSYSNPHPLAHPHSHSHPHLHSHLHLITVHLTKQCAVTLLTPSLYTRTHTRTRTLTLTLTRTHTHTRTHSHLHLITVHWTTQTNVQVTPLNPPLYTHTCIQICVRSFTPDFVKAASMTSTYASNCILMSCRSCAENRGVQPCVECG